MKKLTSFQAMVISMAFTIIVASVILAHIHDKTIIYPDREQVEFKEADISSSEGVVKFKTVVLNNFRLNDAAIAPIEIRIQYDSTNRTNLLREFKLRNSIQKECYQWNLAEALTYPSVFHNNLLERANWFNENVQFIAEVSLAYTDKNNYIDEHFTKESAEKIKKELLEREAVKCSKEELDSAIAKKWEKRD